MTLKLNLIGFGTAREKIRAGWIAQIATQTGKYKTAPYGAVYDPKTGSSHSFDRATWEQLAREHPGSVKTHDGFLSIKLATDEPLTS